MVALVAPSEPRLGDRIKREIDNPPQTHLGTYHPALIVVSDKAYNELLPDERFVSGLIRGDSGRIFGVEVTVGMPRNEFSLQWTCEAFTPQEQAHYVYQQDETFAGLDIHYPLSRDI